MWGAITIGLQIALLLLKYYMSKGREKVTRDEERKKFHRDVAFDHMDNINVRLDGLRKKGGSPPRRPSD